MTGQAARRGLVCVERFARNVASATTPDNRGVVRGAAAPDPGPERLEATVPVGEIARAIRGAGVPARVSTNAGDYVCNHLYYGALAFLRRRLARDARGVSSPAGDARAESGAREPAPAFDARRSPRLESRRKRHLRTDWRRLTVWASAAFPYARGMIRRAPACTHPELALLHVCEHESRRARHG